jgi:hypothetical protein
LDIDSIPPATAMSYSSQRMSFAAYMTAFIPSRRPCSPSPRPRSPGSRRRSRLPRRRLADRRLQDVAHDHLLDLLRLHARVLRARIDGDRAEAAAPGAEESVPRNEPIGCARRRE